MSLAHTRLGLSLVSSSARRIALSSSPYALCTPMRHIGSQDPHDATHTAVSASSSASKPSSSAATAPPPPPPPHRPVNAVDMSGDADGDPMFDLLCQSLEGSAEAPLDSREGASSYAGYPLHASPPLQSSSVHMLAEEDEAGPHAIEQALEQTLGQEEALDYIEAVGRDHAHDALFLDAADQGGGDGGDAEDVMTRFWWRKEAFSSLTDDGADGVEVPLRIPDASGHVPDDDTTSANVSLTAEGVASANNKSGQSARRCAQMMDGTSFLHEMDLLYLAYPARPEVRIPSPNPNNATTPASPRQCVLVVYAANDLRVHDSYPLALASARAQQLNVPVVAVCVLDYRTFAQPSLVGGFFRQSPQRAQFLLDTVAALREKLEQLHHVPLLVRCGRPEEHIPRLAVELGAADVFLTTQYAPHERGVHDAVVAAIREGVWYSRQAVLPHQDSASSAATAAAEVVAVDEVGSADAAASALLLVQAHPRGSPHPYSTHHSAAALATLLPTSAPAVPHSVWQTTLVHLDDLTTPVAELKEGERWYHDEVTTAAIRPTAPYDRQVDKLRTLPSWSSLLPTDAERLGREAVPHCRGRLPTLSDLGYGDVTRVEKALRHFAFEAVIATQSSHPAAGEDAAKMRVHEWLTGYGGSAGSGMTSMLRLGRERRTNTKMHSELMARVSPYIACGALSPRAYYEALREYTHANLRDGFVQMQYREALLRLSRRDYWHWMGLRYGARLFYSYGPRPEDTDAVPEWRYDEKIVQKWCVGLTGIPFADAAMRELLGTGFVAHEGRQALIWLLTTGLSQDWRLGAEWLERCSLDYDPFVCYGNAAYCAQLIPDDFGEPVRGIHYLAHQHDQTGIYVKRWLPQLSKVPPVYIHRPHVMTARMQAMHGVYLGKTYPFPIKLWSGVQQSSLRLRGDVLTAWYPDGVLDGPGVGEAVRHGAAVMEPEEWNLACTQTSADTLPSRGWAKTYLPAEVLLSAEAPQLGGAAEEEEEEVTLVHVNSQRRREAEATRRMTADAAMY